jgi:hypothetical protein
LVSNILAREKLEALKHFEGFAMNAIHRVWIFGTK